METIEAYAPGTKVYVGDNIPAIISKVTIGLALRPLYFIVWWNGREKKEDWFWSEEFKLADIAKKMEIGFH